MTTILKTKVVVLFWWRTRRRTELIAAMQLWMFDYTAISFLVFMWNCLDAMGYKFLQMVVSAHVYCAILVTNYESWAKIWNHLKINILLCLILCTKTFDIQKSLQSFWNGWIKGPAWFALFIPFSGKIKLRSGNDGGGE